MKTIYLNLLLSLGAISSSAQVVNIPGVNFLQALIDHRPTVDQNGDGMIQVSEAELVDSLYIWGKSIADLTGIEAFTALRIVDCSVNDLTTLDVSKNPNLEELYCRSNDLTTLDVTQNPSLERLWCFSNSLTTLDVTQNPYLEELWCSSNDLTTLDVTQNPNLEWLHCSSNDLTTLDVTQNPNLERLWCYSNSLTSLDVTENPNLEELSCIDNSLTTLDVTQNPNLEVLLCKSNDLTTLDVTQNPNLEELQCTDNSLTTLDMAMNPNLERLDCIDNSLTTFDVTMSPNLVSLQCHSNSLTTLDVTQNPNLEELSCGSNDLRTLDVTQNPKLERLHCSSIDLTTLDVTQNVNLIKLSCASNQLTTLDVTQNPNLEWLHCSSNDLTTLDVTQNPKLRWLDCQMNDLMRLDVSKNPKINVLYCQMNDMTALDMKHNPKLEVLWCYLNDLTTLDVSKNSNLEELWCRSNDLTTLDVSKNPNLEELYCRSNDLTTLDVTHNPKLRWLRCGLNNLRALDVSKNPLLTKEKSSSDGLALSSEDSIMYICAHPENLAEVQRELEGLGFDETVVSLFCAYDELVVYQPIVALDDDCSAIEYGDQVPMRVIVGMDTVDFFYTGMSDLYLPHTADTIYIYPTSLDTTLYTLIEDVVELDPTTLAAGLNADSIFLDTLCAEVKVMAYDLVSHLIPTTIARPGFEARYNLIYENRGTETINGSVGFGYDADVLTYVDASIVEDQNLGDSLVWDFADLRPFERREIMITMRLNSPMDTPPLNDGDILTYPVCATPTADDHRPADNCTVLAQTVRNSYDPNDKRCMQGEQLTPDAVGGYLTYMIRFENTGSAEAVNIRVTDEIDTEVFDISTLAPVDASHPYHIEIHEGNEVHFVFPNIYLPFDDANNDGYITFRIKTKDDLAIGDKVKNSASIFFDYNFPIFTNTATTEITDFVSIRPTDRPDVHLSIFPNPSRDFVQIEADAAIQHILLSDAAGRIIRQHDYDGTDTRVQLSLDDLSSGSYQVKVYTARGSALQTILIRN